jgi:hypothetical protein
MSALGRHGAPRVAGESAAERLMRSLDYRLAPEARHLTQREVAIVMHALADHTAIMAALEYARDETCPWPEARSLGRWFHAVGDELERLARDLPDEHRLEGAVCSCGEWEAKLGESIHRGFDRHLLDVTPPIGGCDA